MTREQKMEAYLKKNKPKPPIKTNDAIRNEVLESLISDNNAAALKILFYIAKQNISTNEKISTFKINTKNLCERINISQQTLKRNIQLMMKTTVTFHDIRDDDKIQTFIQLIPKAKFIDGQNQLQIDMYQEIIELISNVKKNFSLVDMDLLMSLKNKNTIRTTMLLERINNYSGSIPKRKRYDLDDLNLLYGTDYKRLVEFVKNIFDKAQDDLSATNSKLNFEYQMHYKKQANGRPKAISVTIDLIQNQSRHYSHSDVDQHSIQII